MTEILLEYKAKLESGARTAKHVKYPVEVVRSVTAFAGFSTVGEITAEGVDRYARQLLDSGRSA